VPATCILEPVKSLGGSGNGADDSVLDFSVAPLIITCCCSGGNSGSGP